MDDRIEFHLKYVAQDNVLAHHMADNMHDCAI